MASVLLDLARYARAQYRQVRSKVLVALHPEGGYVLCNGLHVFCNFRNEAYTWYVDHRRSLALDQRIIRLLAEQSDGGVYLDIGAHWGFFTVYLSHLAEKRSGGRVIALEPDRDHFRLLKDTMKRYPNARCLLLPFALSGADERVTMYETSASCLHSYREAGAVAQYDAPGMSLDTLVQRYLEPGERIGLIKIDVDGAEPTLFSGGQRTLREHKPFIFMEFAPGHLHGYGVNPEEFFRGLCDEFAVYWISYAPRAVRRAGRDSYEQIRRVVGEGVTDLILWPYGVQRTPLDIDFAGG